jgi:phosphatidylserine/phosphatidylglycerophosphate/cardiolipin synthase-like enzyme
MIVNGQKCVFGSYNWSGSAEERNFEDAFVFDAANPAGKMVIDRFMAEFDFLWTRFYGTWNGEGERPYTISGPEGRAWAQRIIKLLAENAEVSKIRDVLDKSGASTVKQIAEEAGVKPADVEKLFAPLLQEKLIKTRQKKDKTIYELAD